MLRKLVTALCFLVGAASPSLSAEPGNEMLVASVLQKSVKAVSSLKPLTSQELRDIAVGRNVVSAVVATDGCSEHFSADGELTCRGPMFNYTGRYRIIENRIIAIVRGRTTKRSFYKDTDKRIYVRGSDNRPSAVETWFYNSGDEAPVKFGG